jgi:hypothetical protein
MQIAFLWCIALAEASALQCFVQVLAPSQIEKSVVSLRWELAQVSH